MRKTGSTFKKMLKKPVQLRLQERHVLLILTPILCITFILAAAHLMQSKMMLSRFSMTGAMAMEKSLLEQLGKRSALLTKLLSDQLKNPLYQLDMEGIRDILQSTLEREDVLYAYVYDPSGHILHDGSENEILLLDLMLEDEVSRKAVRADQFLIQTTDAILDAAMPIRIEGERLGGVRVGFDLRGIQNDTQLMNKRLAYIQRTGLQFSLFWVGIITVVFSLMGLLLAFFVARNVSRPIQQLSVAATRLGQGEYEVNVPIYRGDELGDLADAFRSMTKNLKLQIEKDKELAARIASADVEREKTKELQEAYTKLQKAQDQLVQTEKLAALGRFSSGIAHEVKNPLGIILGWTEYLESRLEKGEPDITQAIDRIKNGVERSNRIIHGLLQFARPSAEERERIEVEKLIRETLELMERRLMMNNIAIRIQFYQSKKLWVEVSKNQIQQVIFNLLVNAADAISRQGEGEIAIMSYPSVVSGQPLNHPTHCAIEISDTGHGITPAHLSKLFEPFFTTKRDQKGVGLGLSISKMIIENHGGTIKAESKEGEGTEMKIVLPLSFRKDSHEKNSGR